MKKLFSAIFLGSLLLLFSGCSSNSIKYSDSDFIGVWMTKDSIESVQEMSNYEKRHFQHNVASLRICEDNTVFYTPILTTGDGKEYPLYEYDFKEKSIVVRPTNYDSGKRTFNIISTDGGYELESDGKRYIKVWDDPYEYDLSKYLL